MKDMSGHHGVIVRHPGGEIHTYGFRNITTARNGLIKRGWKPTHCAASHDEMEIIIEENTYQAKIVPLEQVKHPNSLPRARVKS